MTYLLFAVSALLISIYSWGYVDVNTPFMRIGPLISLVYHGGRINGIAYAGMFFILTFWYWYILTGIRNKTIHARNMLVYLGIFVIVLFFSYPAFSNDIYNYMATARVSFLYRENPYLVMPIDLPNEPMLAFMHAANKVALYGPVWILATFIPHAAGFGNLLVTLFTFKLFVVVWFLAIGVVLWKLTKRLSAVAFCMFNPLVVIDTLIDAHNDVMMMALALFAFYALKKNKTAAAWLLLLLSVFIKGATLLLVPIFLYAWRQKRRNAVRWETVWRWAAYSMFAVFMLSPVREEMYSWYFIWVLSFLALRNTRDAATAVALGFSFGLPLRFLPFAVSRNWEGITPVIKILITAAGPTIALVWYILIQRKKQMRNARK